ncbi:diguanylate cyclase domain-containing protein [Aliagarivorans marinus]|uniref:diguanylate cyclase domain-containing protein n=1 Tax=Aliagarivorans marinus TaxID=561965 RepID=UPI0003FE81C7|nr:diguanylate cyclase [Aliagarivorans marinus]
MEQALKPQHDAYQHSHWQVLLDSCVRATTFSAAALLRVNHEGGVCSAMAGELSCELPTACLSVVDQSLPPCEPGLDKWFPVAELAVAPLQCYACYLQQDIYQEGLILCLWGEQIESQLQQHHEAVSLVVEVIEQQLTEMGQPILSKSILDALGHNYFIIDGELTVEEYRLYRPLPDANMVEGGIKSIKQVLHPAAVNAVEEELSRLLVGDSARVDIEWPGWQLMLFSQDTKRTLLVFHYTESQQRLQYAMEQSGVGYALFDDCGRIQLANGALATLANHQVEQLLNRPYWELFDAGFSKQLMLWHRLGCNGYRGALPKRFECRLEHQGVWVMLGIVRLEGQHSLLSVVDIDIAKRRQQLEQLNAKAFSHSGDAIAITDQQFRIVEANPAFCQLSGYAVEELRGNPPQCLDPGVERERQEVEDIVELLSRNGQWHGEFYNRSKAGQFFPYLVTISVIYGHHGDVCNYVVNYSDISQLKYSEQKLYQMAHHDSLTGLPNRLAFEDSLKQAISVTQRRCGLLAVAFIDIDHFKRINDELGHQMGDQVLCQVSARLRETLRRSDHLSRLGGDEFVVLLQNNLLIDDIEQTLNKLRQKMNVEVYLPNGDKLPVTLSIGASVFPYDGQDSQVLLESADKAMYRAKRNGRDQVQLFGRYKSNS